MLGGSKTKIGGSYGSTGSGLTARWGSGKTTSARW